MISQQEYHFTNKNSQEVERVISDIVLFGKYHPLIVNVIDLGAQSYQVTEKPFGLLPIKVNYHVQVFKELENTIYQISSLPLFKPTLTYRIKNESGTRAILELTLSIDGPEIGKRFLMSKMLAAQDKIWSTFDQKVQPALS